MDGLVGNYKNGGKEYRPKGEPEPIDVHDFKGELGRAVLGCGPQRFMSPGFVAFGTSCEVMPQPITTDSPFLVMRARHHELQQASEERCIRNLTLPARNGNLRGAESPSFPFPEPFPWHDFVSNTGLLFIRDNERCRVPSIPRFPGVGLRLRLKGISRNASDATT